MRAAANRALRECVTGAEEPITKEIWGKCGPSTKSVPMPVCGSTFAYQVLIQTYKTWPPIDFIFSFLFVMDTLNMAAWACRPIRERPLSLFFFLFFFLFLLVRGPETRRI